MLKDSLLFKNNVAYAYADPIANEKNVVLGKTYRLTAITDRLIRIETSPEGIFCDDMTQMVINRASEAVETTVVEEGDLIRLSTPRCEVVYSQKKGRLVAASLDGKPLPVKNKRNLGGTCRTLDNRAGKVKLGLGVLSRAGSAYIEDDSLPLCPDGTVGKKRAETDVYAFLYGQEYRDALQALYFLTGPVPMLPRYVLSNWWSRYHAYTQKEYLDLMDRFEKEDLPFSVATVDMDWHWVDVDERFGEKKRPFPFSAGWTGYSWNTDLFPDYRDFLQSLRKKGLHVTLNLHPADGVRKFETQYKEMAQATGRTPDGSPIPFDLSDEKFIDAYFDVLHRPYEREGVDFWWIDWQQGKKSTVEDLDPLWALNHYHYLDNCDGKKRGLILSRYAGVGSHRYPIGFSGDAMTYWRSLKFQPYMTATAANVGYTWWSHDIGGHNFGICSDELYLRWLQFGCFSPINRLHSTAHDLQGKEPWKRSETVRRIAGDYLRLRHSLVPYLYTAMKETAMSGTPLCEPVYYRYPQESDAYAVKNEYFFGPNLLVCPITSPRVKSLHMAKTEVWLPEGRFTDVFTGKTYMGGKRFFVYRDLEYIPVFARAGAIVPLSSDEGNACENPVDMEVLVYRGNNSYTLYEDDGLTTDYAAGKYAETTFVVSEDEDRRTVKFSISQPAEHGGFRPPEDRTYLVDFRDIAKGNAKLNGVFTTFDGPIRMRPGDEVELLDVAYPDPGDPLENIRDVLSRYQGRTLGKILRYWDGKYIKSADKMLRFVKRRFPKDVYRACLETTLWVK
ncbi:MAG: DUF5110 domain-containing protein [Clostridia bacterium]|nr:DUF5110 domain-containing protein [Clostridia bacterium]